MKIKATVQFVCQKRRHGKRPVRSRANKSAAVARLQKEKILAKLQQGNTISTDDVETVTTRDAVSKGYGEHSGSTQIHVISEFEFEGELDGQHARDIENVINSHEEKVASSLDVKAKKREYFEKKSQIEADYHARFGDSLSEQQMDKLQNEIAKYSFEYYSCQIVIRFESDEPFASASLSEKDGKYVFTVRSKAVYRAVQPSKEAAKSYERSLGKGSVTRSVIKTLGLRAVWVPDANRKAGGRYEVLHNGYTVSANTFT